LSRGARMSYQLGAAQPPQRFMAHKPMPARPARPARIAARPLLFHQPAPPGVLPIGAFRPGHNRVRVQLVKGQPIVVTPGTAVIPGGSNLAGLGFSLKRPKWMRKLTIKKVIKPLAITAGVIVGAAFIPGALPLLAKGVVGAGKLAMGTGRLAVRGVTGAGKFAVKNVGAAAKVFTSPTNTVPQTTVDASKSKESAEPGTDNPTNAQIIVTTPNVATGSTAQAPAASQTTVNLPSPANVDFTTGEEAPQQAGLAGGIVPLAIGGVALLAIMSMQKRGR
ncbi:MAG: hypothetical protein V1750_06845, partial [Acidobacteriota bacterium]